MTRPSTRRLLVAMVREEWRLHNRLFAGRRFAAFPAFIVLLVAGAGALLVRTGQSTTTVIAGAHALALVFGLHTGSIGLVGRDAIRNLLGEMTLLVFSARTLPVSRRRLFGVFLVKDVAYYAVLFLLPMAIGLLPVLLGASGGGPSEAIGSSALLWATLTATFALGIGTTLAVLGLRRYRFLGPLAMVAVAGAIGVAWVAELGVLAYTPYGLYQDPSLTRFAGSLTLLAGIFAIGASTFEVTDERASRRTDPLLGRLADRIGDPLAAKTLLDVHRSAGGFGKVIFSAAVLLGVTAALVDLAGKITGVSPSVGVSFGAILGLTGFTTYNWLTQFDDVDAYRHHPVDVRAVFRAKYRAFLLLGPVVGLAFYLLSVVWLGGPATEVLVGAVLLVGVASYIFGVTVSLTGLSPNEFLFDSVLFAGFGLAVMVPLVPILIVGFALAPLESHLLVALALAGAGLGALGLVLYRRSIPRWMTYHRT